MRNRKRKWQRINESANQRISESANQRIEVSIDFGGGCGSSIRLFVYSCVFVIVVGVFELGEGLVAL
jgi:hypothetical protein